MTSIRHMPAAPWHACICIYALTSKKLENNDNDVQIYKNVHTDMLSLPAPSDDNESSRFHPSRKSLTKRRSLSTMRKPVILIAPYSMMPDSQRSSITWLLDRRCFSIHFVFVHLWGCIIFFYIYILAFGMCACDVLGHLHDDIPPANNRIYTLPLPPSASAASSSSFVCPHERKQ